MVSSARIEIQGSTRSFSSPDDAFTAVLAVKGSLTPRLENGAPLTAAGRRELPPPWRKRKKKGLSYPGFIG
jgi:hypothetical protein